MGLVVGEPTSRRHLDESHPFACLSSSPFPSAGLPAPWLLGPRSSSPHLARGRAPARTATRTSLAFTDTSHADVMITTAEPRR